MNARKKIGSVFFLFLALFSLSCFRPQISLAKKKIGSQPAGVRSAVPASYKIVIAPKLRTDRRALQVNFSNLGQVVSFTYELTYEAGGVDQGVYGSVTPKGENSIYREILFGTCSGSVCRYHSGLTNMKFSTTTTYKNGSKTIKRYRVYPKI